MADKYDIIGYHFRGSDYCREHIMPVVYEANPGWELAEGIHMPVEEDLNEIAFANSIDRTDQSSFHSDEFPKVVREGDFGTPHCSVCGLTLSAD